MALLTLCLIVKAMGGIGGAIGAVQQGEAEAASDTQKAFNAADQYWEDRIKGNQQDTAMTQHLASTLSNINAVRAASGAELSSPSGEAVQNATLGLGLQDISRTELNANNAAMQQLSAMNFYNKAAEEARSNESLGVIGSLVGGLGGLIGKFF